MMRRFSLGIGVGLLIALAVFGCRTAPDVVRVKMDYTPTNIVTPPKSFPQTLIFMAPIEDKRKDPDLIGQNSETAKAVPVKADPAEIRLFVADAFKKEFKKVGLNVVESEAEASRILKITLLNLWVEEKNTYQSSLVAQVTVLDKSGKKLFDDSFRAMAQRWGTSYAETEYRKAISDTVVDLLKNLFNNEAFLKGLS